MRWIILWRSVHLISNFCMCTLKVREGGVRKVVGGNLEAGTSVLKRVSGSISKIRSTISKLNLIFHFLHKKAIHFYHQRSYRRNSNDFWTLTRKYSSRHSLFILPLDDYGFCIVSFINYLPGWNFAILCSCWSVLCTFWMSYRILEDFPQQS